MRAGTLAIAVAICLTLLPTAPAVAADASWTAMHGAGLSYYAPPDLDRIDATTPYEFRPSWWRVAWRSGTAEEWPTSIRLVTELEPARLSVWPAATPAVSGTAATYDWSVSTNQPASVYGTGYPRSVTPGVSLERSANGPREVGANGTVTRLYTFRIATTTALPELQLRAQFRGSGPVQTSGLSCTPAESFSGNGGDLKTWWFTTPPAGFAHTVTCSVTLTNTASSSSAYAPFVSAWATLERTSVPLAAGATSYTTSVADLGQTTVAVTPPGIVTGLTGTVETLSQRGITLAQVNGPAAAPVSWTGQAVATSRLDEPGDAVDDAVRTFTRQWQEALFSASGTSWPGEVKVTTARTGLTLQPPPSRVEGTDLIWAVQTNGARPFQLDGPVSEMVGMSLRRSIAGGRAVDPGPASSRTIEVDFTAARSFVTVQLSLNFTRPGPVTASAVTCSPATASLPTGQMNWFLHSVSAGASLRVTCTFSVSSQLSASYTPSVFVSAIESRDETVLAGGATAGATSNDLGSIAFTISPPAGTEVQGMIRTLGTRLVSLDTENAVSSASPPPPAPPPATSWTGNAFATSRLNVPGDAVEDVERTFWREWRETLFSAGTSWPGEVRVTTARTGLTLHPAPSRVEGADLVWAFQTNGTQPFQLNGPVSEMVGMSLRRSVTGGRRVDPGPATSRTIQVDFTSARSFATVQLSLNFTLNSTPPGPVTASDVSCSPTTADPPTGQMSWFLHSVDAGASLRVTCTFTVSNSSLQPASYTPSVFVSATESREETVLARGATSGTTSNDLGAIAFTVSPPPGTEVQGRIRTLGTRVVALEAENTLLATQSWNGSVTQRLSKSTAGDSTGEGMQDLQPSWTFTVSAFPVAWPARIDVTTSRPADELTPSPAPTTTGGGSYTWNGSTPLFSTTLSSTGTFAADLGFVAERTLLEGRLVPGGNAVTRHLAITVRTTALPAPDQLTVEARFSTAVPPGTPELPVATSDVDCPGSIAGASPDARSWVVRPPVPGATMQFVCTFTATNSDPDDAFYMPGVFVHARRDSSTVAQLGATTLAQELASLGSPGSVTFTVEPVGSAIPLGSTSLRDARFATLFREDRVAPRPTRLEYTGPLSTTYPDGIPFLAARLTQVSTGAPLAGRRIWFELDGAAVGNALTNESGEARLATGAPFLAGSLPAAHSVKASFNGNAAHSPSSATADLRILRRPTTLEHTTVPTQTYGFVTLEARLRDTLTGDPIAGRPIAFTFDGVAVGTRTTDASGVARFTGFTPAAPASPGTHAVGVAFAGDARYRPSDSAGSVTVINSIGRVTGGGVRTASGANAGFVIRYDGAELSGSFEFDSDGLKVHGTTILALGISADGTRAVFVGRTDDGRRFRVSARDRGEPGVSDVLAVSIDGVPQSGDGSILRGNIQILR